MSFVIPAACSSPTDLAIPVVSSIESMESGPLIHTLNISLEGPSPLAVRYQTSDGPALRVRSSSATDHVVQLSRLRPDRTYSYEVEGTSHRGTFETDTLPTDLAGIGLAASGAPTVPLVLLHLFREDGYRGYAVVDGDGEVVWYWRTEDYPFGMTRRGNGNFVFMDKGRGLVEVSPDGVVAHELPQFPAASEMHHDVVATGANTLIFLAFDTRHIDSVPVKGEAIWEWAPESGDTAKRWSSWDHFSVTDDRGPRFGGEWMHANALAVAPQGNVLVSVHYWNQVISIPPGWSEIAWRLGGVNATIVVPDEERFTGQHTAAELAPGRVLLFDNRVEQGSSSRVAEFELLGERAVRRWEWRPPSQNFSPFVSSARRLPNGHTVVAFGMSEGLVGASGPTEVFEVTAAGEVVWHLVVSNVRTMFRAEPLLSIAAEELVAPDPN